MTARFNLFLFLHLMCTKPGDVLFFGGHMGDGKTHTAVTMAQIYTASAPQPTYILTNILFEMRLTERSRGKGYPPNVIPVRTMVELLHAIDDLMQRHPDGNFRAIWILDEAQNFMQAESHMSPFTTMIHAFMANIRKINLAVWILTPLEENVGPRMREGKVTGKPGYVTVLVRKNLPMIRQFLKQNEIDPKEAKRFTTVKWDLDTDPYVIFVPAPSWTTPLDQLAVGDCAYDSRALAMFSLGHGFDFDKLVDAISDCTSREVPALLHRFLHSPTKTEEKKDPEDELMDRVHRGRDKLDIKWGIIADYEGIKESTLKTRYYEAKKKDPSKFPDASKKTDDGTNTHTRAKREEETELEEETATRGDSPIPTAVPS